MYKKLSAVLASFAAAFAFASPASAIINPDVDLTNKVPSAVVALHYTDDLEPRFQFCSGTLISNRWVLTAAHCLTQFGTSGTFMVVANQRTATTLKRVAASVERFAIHPEYQYSEYGTLNDVALVLLAERLPGVTPIKLIGSDDTAAVNDPNGFVLYGWGQTVARMNSARALAVRQFIRTVPEGMAFTPGHHIATLNLSAAGETKSSCYGDSGGPLVSHTDGKPRIVAIVAYGVSDCLEAVPGVSTRIAPQRDWIKRTMGR